MQLSPLQLPVRERQPPYGGTQDFDRPAREALLDLGATEDPRRVIARYAVLRAALLPRAAAPAVRAHALSAAGAYLDAAADGWAEAAALRLVLSASPLSGRSGSADAAGRRSTELRAALLDAAAEAELGLDRHGAALLRRLARRHGAGPVTS